ncbi:MAG: response regulator, partial [Acidobacteria bacterium]|nr:response regulator [Acidobacteriota bacterium]
PEVRSRLFEPFFTTKFLGRGLGLPAALGILRGHRGGFQVHSVPGQGSVFRALFPMAVEAPPARETILLVDDEEMVVRVGKMALERAGYNVLVAQSGAGALDIFKAHNEAIAAVVLDLKMPEMSGAELLERLLVLRPDLRVLVATAYDEEEALRQTSRGATGFLHKPYTAAAFTRKVQEILRT